MKRDYINEIKSIRNRKLYDSSTELNFRLNKIENILINITNFDVYEEEILKYIPISTVSCIEAFFRTVYAELIHHGKPFTDNMEKLNELKNTKLDFEILKAIQYKAFTLGEFISHVLPLNNLNDINRVLSILMNIDFLDSLKNYDPKTIYDDVLKNHLKENIDV